MRKEIRTSKAGSRKQSEIRDVKRRGVVKFAPFLPQHLSAPMFLPSFRRPVISDFGFWLVVVFQIFVVCPLLAQTNVVSGDEIPPLLPPRAEMPPSFEEKYGVWLILGGILLVVLLCGAIWVLTRPKPAKMIPPAVQARAALEPLGQRPEDGVVLTRVSQVLRRYVSAAFEITQDELTTTEFCQALGHVEQVGPGLSSELARFLQECDRRKFAPGSPSSTVAPLGAVDRASKFIDQAEGRLAQIREAAAATPPPVCQA